MVALLGRGSARFLDLVKIGPNKTAVDVSPKALDHAAQQAFKPPPPAPPLPPAPAAPVDRSKYHVFIQFAGVLRREDVAGMAKALNGAGWKVEGADRGGERTAAASVYNEVRYSDGNDAAATELTPQVQAANLTCKAIVVVKNNAVGENNLEIWISS